MPQYIGPYNMIKAHKEALTVTQELPDKLKDCRISPVYSCLAFLRHAASFDIPDLKTEREVPNSLLCDIMTTAPAQSRSDWDSEPTKSITV
ncbi:hypothetical protein JB92DRAFT_2853670 [Gautieria morchelliformis]|nr:hypothetical protein JB92DRAFT_2853670 [Gautieria morchelliformis]